MCGGGSPPSPKGETPPLPDPPAEIELDDAGRRRREERARQSSNRAGRSALRIQISTASAARPGVNPGT